MALHKGAQGLGCARSQRVTFWEGEGRKGGTRGAGTLFYFPFFSFLFFSFIPSHHPSDSLFSLPACTPDTTNRQPLFNRTHQHTESTMGQGASQPLEEMVRDSNCKPKSSIIASQPASKLDGNQCICEQGVTLRAGVDISIPRDSLLLPQARHWLGSWSHGPIPHNQGINARNIVLEFLEKAQREKEPTTGDFFPTLLCCVFITALAHLPLLFSLFLSFSLMTLHSFYPFSHRRRDPKTVQAFHEAGQGRVRID